MMKLKRYMWLAICSTVLLVAGCSTDFTPEQLSRALEACGKNDGIKTININTNRDSGKEISGITCNDGAKFTFYKL